MTATSPTRGNSPPPSPLPQVVLESTMLDMISEEELGWVLINKEVWRPRRTKGQRGAMLVDPVRLPGYRFPYDAMIWDGKGNVYLVDALTYALLYDSQGRRTAKEIVEDLITSYVSMLPEDDNLRMAFEKKPGEMTEDDRDIVYGSIAGMYAQLALLRKLGLIV